MTPQSIITLARYIINDTDSSGYRQSDAELLSYVNAALKEASIISPGHFLNVLDFACAAGKTEQKLTFPQAQALFQVIRIKSGPAVQVMDLVAMNQFNPNWQNDTPGPAQNWAKYSGDKLRFYIYPAAPVMQTLEVSCVRNPGVYTINSVITEVPDSWESALADYVVYRAESKDDEFVENSRAVSFFQSFVQKVSGAAG